MNDFDEMDDDALPSGLRQFLEGPGSDPAYDNEAPDEINDDGLEASDDEATYDDQPPAAPPQHQQPQQGGADPRDQELAIMRQRLAQAERESNGRLADLAAQRQRRGEAETKFERMAAVLAKRLGVTPEELLRDPNEPAAPDPDRDPAGALLHQQKQLFGKLEERFETFEQRQAAEQEAQVEAQVTQGVARSFSNAAAQGAHDLPRVVNFLTRWIAEEHPKHENPALLGVRTLTAAMRKALTEGKDPATELYRLAIRRGYRHTPQQQQNGRPAPAAGAPSALERRQQMRTEPAQGNPAGDQGGDGRLTKEVLESLSEREFALLEEALEAEGRSMDSVLQHFYGDQS